MLFSNSNAPCGWDRSTQRRSEDSKKRENNQHEPEGEGVDERARPETSLRALYMQKKRAVRETICTGEHWRMAAAVHQWEAGL
jgi:hypothetical protein